MSDAQTLGTFTTPHPVETVLQEIVLAGLEDTITHGGLTATAPPILARVYVGYLSDKQVAIRAGNAIETYFEVNVLLEGNPAGTGGHVYLDRPLARVTRWKPLVSDITKAIYTALVDSSSTLHDWPGAR